MRLIAFSRAPALIAAQRHGFFAAEGLDVEIARATGSTAQLAALLAGEHDVAHTAADNVVARVDLGLDLRIVLVADRGADHRLVGGPAVRAPSDLAGRRLGVDAATSGHALLAYVLLAEAGIARGSYEIVPVGSTRDRCAALLAGRIDAAMLSSPHDERAAAAGCHVLADARARFPEHAGLTVAVAGAWATAHRDALTGYCRALMAGARFAADHVNRDAVIADLVADGEAGPDEAARRYEHLRPRPVPTIDEMVRAVDSVCALRRAAGLATGSYDVARYFDPSFVRGANANGAPGR